MKYLNLQCRNVTYKVVLLLSLFVLSFFLNTSKGQDTIVVDVSSVVGPAIQRGSGFLCGYSGSTIIPDNLLDPLKPNLLRCNMNVISSAYDRAKALGCKLEIMFNVGWDKSNVPGANGNWTPWLDHVTSIVNECITKNMSDVHFCIWNDPDIPTNWQASDAQFFECWKRTYNKIRELIPSAVIVGPASTWGPIGSLCKWWEEHEGDELWYVRTFLDYCIDNDVVPDIVSVHNWAKNGRSIESHAKELENYFLAKGMQPLPFEQDDIGPSWGQFKPGIFVSYFASIERSKVAYAAKCCWDNDCFSNTLNGLLTKDSREKRSLWWAFKLYADITGDILHLNGSANIDGVAGLDSENKIIRMVLGRHTDQGDLVVVQFKNMDLFNYDSLNVQKQIIPNSEENALPVIMSPVSKSFSVDDNDVFITLNDLGDYGICNLIISEGEPVAETFTLTVTNGSGSGEYSVNDIVNVIADPAPDGMKFYQWTGTTEGLDDRYAQNTFYIMPGLDNRSLTATYRDILQAGDSLVIYENQGSATGVDDFRMDAAHRRGSTGSWAWIGDGDASDKHLFIYFPKESLTTKGDKLELAMFYGIGSAAGHLNTDNSTPNAFRLGLFNNNGTIVNDNSGITNPGFSDYSGYYGTFSVKSSIDPKIFKRNTGQNSLILDNAGNKIQPGKQSSDLLELEHRTLTLELEKTEDGVNVSYIQQGSSGTFEFTGNDHSNPEDTFNTLAVGLDDTPELLNYLFIDWMRVTFYKSDLNTVHNFSSVPSEINVYPNPASSYFAFKLNAKADNYEIIISDLSGKKVAEKYIFFDNLVQFNSEGWERGSYFYQILSNNRIIGTGKVILE
jgi:hypothetical protein